MMPSFINSLYFITLLGFMSVTQVSQAQECPPTGQINIPHTNCSLYIHCNNGLGTLMSCHEHLYFNPVMNICDYPDNVPECVGGTRPPSGTTTPIPTTVGPSNGCPTEGFKPIPHSERCEKFIYCLDGEIIDEKECPAGLYFDPVLELCNLKELVDCRNPEDSETRE